MSSAAPQRILVATDLSAESFNLYQLARRLLGPDGTLHLLHVLDPGEPLWSALVRDYSPEGIERQVMFQAESALLDLDPSPLPLPRLEAHITLGHPSEQILSLASQLSADLVLLGVHHRAPWKELLLGDVTDRVVRCSPCPVMVVPLSHEAQGEERTPLQM